MASNLWISLIITVFQTVLSFFNQHVTPVEIERKNND